MAAITPKGTVFFPNLKTVGEMSQKYEITLVFDPKDSPELIDAMKSVAKEKATEKFSGDELKSLRSPFRSCTENEKYFGDFPEGSIYISFKSNRMPNVVDFNVKTIDGADVYHGDIARVTYSCYAYNVSGNKGVAFGLQNVQKIKDGENSTGVNAFDPVEGGSNTPGRVVEEPKQEELEGNDFVNEDIPF